MVPISKTSLYHFSKAIINPVTIFNIALSTKILTLTVRRCGGER